MQLTLCLAFIDELRIGSVDSKIRSLLIDLTAFIWSLSLLFILLEYFNKAIASSSHSSPSQSISHLMKRLANPSRAKREQHRTAQRNDIEYTIYRRDNEISYSNTWSECHDYCILHSA
jgi:hypothetical protein